MNKAPAAAAAVAAAERGKWVPAALSTDDFGAIPLEQTSVGNEGNLFSL